MSSSQRGEDSGREKAEMKVEITENCHVPAHNMNPSWVVRCREGTRAAFVLWLDAWIYSCVVTIAIVYLSIHSCIFDYRIHFSSISFLKSPVHISSPSASARSSFKRIFLHSLLAPTSLQRENRPEI